MHDASPARPVVVGYDGTPQAKDALALGAALAATTGDRLILAGAFGADPLLSGGELDSRRAEVLDRLGQAAQELAPAVAGPVERRAVLGTSAASALQELAEAEHPRALVLGSCHRGAVGRVVIGSVAERLLHGAPCPVVVASRGLADAGAVELRTVCVGFDGGPEAWTALQRAAQVASAAGARLRVALVVPAIPPVPMMPVLPAELLEERDRAAGVELDHAVRSVTKAVQAESRLLNGDPATRLAEEAARDVDLLVVGSRGYGPVRHVLLGSVSAALMHSSPCPVMVVPRTAEFDPSATGMAADDELSVSG
jgi:nucleotide-binding universal stress UspA family protein